MLELLDASESPGAQGLIVIVGWAATAPQLGAYIFEREELRNDQATITLQQPAPLPPRSIVPRDVGHALSAEDPAPSRSTWAACAPSTTPA